MRARRGNHTDSSAHGYTFSFSYPVTFPFSFTNTGADADTYAAPDGHTPLHAYREFQRRLRACRQSGVGREHRY